MFTDRTMLTSDWLKNNADFEIKGTQQQQDNKFRQYYIDVCNYVNRHFYMKPTSLDIEEYIDTGLMTFGDTIHSCKIKDRAEREYLFLLAQAKQLIYDYTNGRGAMIRGEDKGYNVNEDFKDIISSLGLYQRTIFAR